jgi:2-hydroxychromene-2-carboxylate isomerase
VTTFIAISIQCEGLAAQIIHGFIRVSRGDKSGSPAEQISRVRIMALRQRYVSFPVNTLTLMRGAIAAQRLGVFERYVEEMFRHMWAEPKKIDDPEVWQSVLAAAGFDAPQFAALVQDSQIKAVLLANTERSVERGTFGSPTFFVGDEIFFGKDRLRDVEELLGSSPALEDHAGTLS